jgi:hypothetical protein
MTVKTLLASLSRRRYAAAHLPEAVAVRLSVSQHFTLERSASALGLTPERLAHLLFTAALSETAVHLRADLAPGSRAAYIKRVQAQLDQRYDELSRLFPGGPDRPD